MEPVAVGLHGGQDALLQGQGHHLPPLQGGRRPLDPDELALAGGAAGHLSGGDAGGGARGVPPGGGDVAQALPTTSTR